MHTCAVDEGLGHRLGETQFRRVSGMRDDSYEWKSARIG